MSQGIPQETIDKEAFDRIGKLAYEPRNDEKPYLTNVPEGLRAVFEHAQSLAWEAALKWERVSPNSLSSKRLMEYRKLVE